MRIGSARTDGATLCRWAAVVIAELAGGMASAQTPMRNMHVVTALPSDCRSIIGPQMRGTVQPWQAYVWLEHCDRIKRLQRLSILLPPDQQPQFYEGIVPAERLPSEFGTDIPVLRVVFPDRTFFDTADAKLRPEAQQITAIVAESLRREPPDVALFIAGHADERGDRNYNERLSIDRADSIAQTIFRAGVSFSSIWRIGFGEDMPLVSGSSPYAWDRNRRVEFLFSAKPEAVATWLADQQLDELCQARDSMEVAECKRRLDFRETYDALEVTRPPVSIAPPKDHHRQSLDPSTTARHRVTPGQGATQRVDPSTSALIGLTPEGTRRISIDPRARRVAPVRVDL